MALRYLARKGGHNNGGAKKPVKKGMNMDPEFAAILAQLEANREAIKKSLRDEKINRRLIVGSGVAAVAFTWVITEPGLI